jgi:hypothetical protein
MNKYNTDQNCSIQRNYELVLKKLVVIISTKLVSGHINDYAGMGHIWGGLKSSINSKLEQEW